MKENEKGIREKFKREFWRETKEKSTYARMFVSKEQMDKENINFISLFGFFFSLSHSSLECIGCKICCPQKRISRSNR